MTLHTAKGLEYDAVFITGIEEELLPHRMAAMEPGGEAEERRLFYVGITRARLFLHLSLAMQRAMFGQTNLAMPSRYLQEIPADLIDWRESQAGIGGVGRAIGGGAGYGSGGYASRSGSTSGWREPDALPERPKTEWANRVTNKMRDNGDLELAAGDRIRHADFGDGRVNEVTGEGAKRVAHCTFDRAGNKKLLIKVAPIEKI
jgi:DNA helicase-2/ATP-dependent DNA helicase PcrA